MSSFSMGGTRIPHTGFAKSIPGKNIIEGLHGVSGFELTMKSDVAVIANGHPFKAQKRWTECEPHYIFEVEGKSRSCDTTGNRGGFNSIVINGETDYFIETFQYSHSD